MGDTLREIEARLTGSQLSRRRELQKMSGYNPDLNYCGPEAVAFLKYPKWFVFGKYLNWPSFRHDCNFEQEDRTTKNNKLMRYHYAQELHLDGVSSDEFYFLLAMLWFNAVIYPLISVVGRVIDK